MQNGENYSKIFNEASDLYLSDDQERVYNVIASDYLTATRIQMYEISKRKRTFIEFQSGYTHNCGCWLNGVHYNGRSKTMYYYPEFISIYVDENGIKRKEVGTGFDLSNEAWKDISELIEENFGDITLLQNHIYGRCKQHRIYVVSEQKKFSIAQ